MSRLPLQTVALASTVMLASSLWVPSVGASALPSPTEHGARAIPADISGLVGTVSGGLGDHTPMPLQDAAVYAYRVTDLTVHRAQTDRRGSFSFASLPAGVYKVIAHKTGFLPAVVLVTRSAASAFQELQLQLFPNGDEGIVEGDEDTDFWRIRRRIPADVLREIEIAVAAAHEPDPSREYAPSLDAELSGRMHALTGSGAFGGIEGASMVGGHFDVEGRLGSMELGVVGNYRSLSRPEASIGTVGRSQSVAVALEHQDAGSLRISGQQGNLARPGRPIDLERYDVDWQGELGPGQSAISANFVEEANYYRDPRLDFIDLPASSRTLDISGTYDQRFTDRVGVRTGLRYRQRDPIASPTTAATDPHSGQIEAFGISDLGLGSSMSVQYGLFTTLRDGSVAFTPHGGFVVDLGSRWQAETTFRQRLHQTEDQWTSDFVPAHYGGHFECTSAEEGCYRLRLAGDLGDRGSISIGALHRTFADTLRLYFNSDLFDDLDSVFLVEGDELPELHFSYARRLAPTITARFESNVADGGGGAISTSRGVLENSVRYVVTSIDTQFEGSETGVLVAFHSLEQRFLEADGSDAVDPVDRDRLQILVTQGLSRLIGMNSELELILDMQLSRSDDPLQLASSDDDLRRRVLGGIALRF